MDQHISTPITEQIAENLQAGDYVYLNGTIYVARDAAHKRMAEALDRGEELPIPIPVSYTHLDVYKRQPPDCTGI